MEHLQDFLYYLKTLNYSSHTQIAYERDLIQYRDFCSFSKKDPFQPETLYRFFSYLSGNLKLSESSLERKKASLSAYAAFLKNRNHSPLLNLDRIQAPKKKKPVPHHYSDEEIRKMLASLNPENPLEYRNYFFLLCAYGTGLRLSELLSLKPGQIQKSGHLIIQGKGNQERVVYLPRPVIQEYEKYFQRFKEEILSADALFFNARKKPLSASGAQKILKQIGIRAFLSKPVHPHAFRHTFATRLLDEGADIRKVSDLLGHASLSTTQKYTHLTRKRLQEALRNFHPHG